LKDNPDIYSSYMHFLEIFLNDSSTRTEDPWKASEEANQQMDLCPGHCSVGSLDLWIDLD